MLIHKNRKVCVWAPEQTCAPSGMPLLWHYSMPELAHQDNGLQRRTIPQQLLAPKRHKRCAPNLTSHCQLRTKELLGLQKKQHPLCSRMYIRGPALTIWDNQVLRLLSSEVSDCDWGNPGGSVRGQKSASRVCKAIISSPSHRGCLRVLLCWSPTTLSLTPGESLFCDASCITSHGLCSSHCFLVRPKPCPLPCSKIRVQSWDLGDCLFVFFPLLES